MSPAVTLAATAVSLLTVFGAARLSRIGPGQALYQVLFEDGRGTT